MNTVDGSEHYSKESSGPPPSLLTLVLDTNPRSWAILAPKLSLPRVLANLIVYINAHLAINPANRVSVIASHIDKARWLYPSRPTPVSPSKKQTSQNEAAQDQVMTDLPAEPSSNVQITKLKLKLNGPSQSSQKHGEQPLTDANKYRPFRLVENEVMSSIQALISETTPEAIEANPTTLMAGALSMALARISKETQQYAESQGLGDTSRNAADGKDSSTEQQQLQSRILVVSVSGDAAFQYIPVMNCIFAAQRNRIPMDVLKLHEDSTFLQQAADATGGIYLRPEAPSGLLQYLMMAFLPNQTSRRYLVLPTQSSVDFRSTCFCHKKVIDKGFVCSICLSIFCEPLADGICLICGSQLKLGNYGATPAVVAKKKKKRKKNAGTRDGTPTASNVGTPAAS